MRSLYRKGLLACCLLAAPLVRAQETLSLEQCVAEALVHNLDLQLAALEPARSREQIAIEQADFDPQLSATARHNERKSPLASSLLDGASRPESDNRAYQFSIGKKLEQSGGEISLQTRLNRNASNSSNALLNPDYSSELGLDLRQPLLRGAWEAATLGLERAQRDSDVAQAAYRSRLLETLATAERRYWEASAAAADLALSRSALESAELLLKETQARRDLGLATGTDLLEARAELENRRSQLHERQRNTSDALAELLSQMGRKPSLDLPALNFEPLPAPPGSLPALSDRLALALAQDPELLRLQALERSRKLGLAQAEDQLQPRLDLVAGAAYLGRDQDGFESYSDNLERESWRWNLGLELSYPWGNRAAKARKRLAERNLEAVALENERLERDVQRDLSRAQRALETARKRHASDKLARELREQAHAETRDRYAQGVATIRDVIESRRDLDESERAELAALLRLKLALIELNRLDASLLERYAPQNGTTQS